MTNLSEQAPPRGLQFSLSIALTAIVFAAAVLAFWISYRQFTENKRLRDENAHLRSELGLLSIEAGTESDVHAVAMPTDEPLTWKWRLYIPPGKGYRLTTTIGQIPDAGTPPGKLLNGELSPGGHVVTLSLLRDEQNRWAWLQKITGDNQDWTSAVGIQCVADDAVEFLMKQGRSDITAAVGKQPVLVEPPDELELLRYRMFPQPQDTSSVERIMSSSSDGEGVLVCITPKSNE